MWWVILQTQMNIFLKQIILDICHVYSQDSVYRLDIFMTETCRNINGDFIITRHKPVCVYMYVCC